MAPSGFNGKTDCAHDEFGKAVEFWGGYSGPYMP